MFKLYQAIADLKHFISYNHRSKGPNECVLIFSACCMEGGGNDLMRDRTLVFVEKTNRKAPKAKTPLY